MNSVVILMVKWHRDSNTLFSNPKTCRGHEAISHCQQFYLLNGIYRCKIDDEECLYQRNKLKCKKLELNNKVGDKMRTITQTKKTSSSTLKQHKINSQNRYKEILGKDDKKITQHCQKLKEEMPNKKEFYRGILHALSIIALHDNETVYKAVVNNVNVEELICAAKEESSMDWSGLRKYGYK